MKILHSYKSRLGESPIYCNQKNTLYWVDIYGKTIQLWNDQTFNQIKTDLRPTSIGLTTNPDILFTTLENNAGYLDLRTHKMEYFYKEMPLLNSGYRLNDGKVYPNGHSYFVGSMNENGEKSKGQLYDINKDQSFVLRNIGTEITNGICWDKKHNFFYANSTEKKIYRVDGEGMIDEMDWLIKGEPDGSCVDCNNVMYNAEYGAHQISLYNLNDLTRMGSIKLDCERPTCPTWGGVDKNILFCTSAQDDGGNGGEVYYKKVDDVEGELTYRFVMPFRFGG